MDKGSSGAYVIVRDDYVIKHVQDDDNPRAVERLIDQANWLIRHSSPAVPDMYSIFDRSYAMERLTSLPLLVIDHQQVLVRSVEQLNTHIWSQPPEVTISHDLLQRRIETILEQHGLSRMLVRIHKAYQAVRWNDLHQCLTHGDPTFENMMIREHTGELVLIDPIPASTSIPDLRCVDVGKLLQSALGWELVRYNDPTQRWWVPVSEVMSQICRVAPNFTPNEENASRLWCVIHLLRTLPYVKNSAGVYEQVRRLLDEAVALL